MYWYAKVILACIVISIVGGVTFVFRGYLPDISFGEEAVIGQNELPEDPVVPADTPEGTAVVPVVQLSDEEKAAIQKLDMAARHEQADELLKSRKLCENVLADPAVSEYSDLWYQTAELLSRVNTKLLMTDAPCPEKATYTVASGDSLWKIARDYKTTVGSIQKNNRLNETNPTIFPGQVLKIYQADWNIHVSKAQHTLQLSNGKTLVLMYKVGIGRQDRTPTGTFVIDNKQAEPAWTPPGKHIPFGHPENVLGTRWLSLKPIEGTNPNLKGYGIHGTWEPESIGGNASNGCIRMVNAQVEELFDIVAEGVRVIIVE
jgi:lipoprotein-anchoring transpeptidase ErfK/SrfK